MTIATYSQKTDWIELIDTEERTNYYKVHTEDTAWFKVDLKKDNKKHKGKVIRKILILIRFDCDKGTYGILSTIFYDDDSEVIEKESVNELFLTMEYVIPDSSIENYYIIFCNRDKKD
jgi:hypothetical protein